MVLYPFWRLIYTQSSAGGKLAKSYALKVISTIILRVFNQSCNKKIAFGRTRTAFHSALFTQNENFSLSSYFSPSCVIRLNDREWSRMETWTLAYFMHVHQWPTKKFESERGGGAKQTKIWIPFAVKRVVH